MFEDDASGLDSAAVAVWVARLTRLERDVDDTERINQLALLERLKSAAAAAQAVVTTDFVASQRAKQLAAGVPAERLGQGVSAQVALARRESPSRGSRHVGLAQALVADLPQTMAALRTGDISEWRATIVVRETLCLDAADRRAADAELGLRLGQLGDRQVEAEARRVAYRLDPRAFVDRTRGAERDRRVTVRPAPDTMSRLTGFLPVAQGVAAYATLVREADRLRAEGDTRSRGQIMADTMVERLTGQAAASQTPLEVVLVMPEETLLRGGREPADLLGGGPLPAATARTMVREAPEVWLRRVYARPTDGSLVAMESRRRKFPRGLRRFLLVRDQVCRTSWCGAAVRQADHVVDAVFGGATSAANGQGLCEACNYAKQAPGWLARPGPGGAGDRVERTTPTGHTYTSQPPPLRPCSPRGRGDPQSLMEYHVRRVLDAA